MDLKTFDFPELTDVDVVFSTLGTNKELLEEAKKRGFYDGEGPYNKMFSSLFYDGGQVEFKSDLDEDFKNIAWKYCRCLMKSFSPKHEDKEAICSMLMSELLELPKQKENGLINKIKRAFINE